MDNELLILMLDALRLEIRNLALQGIMAEAVGRDEMTDKLLTDAKNESMALQQRSDNAANTALGHA